MTDIPQDLDDTAPQLAPEREARRKEAACEVGGMLLKVQHEQGLHELEDAARGAMIGIGEVLGQVEGGHSFFIELCTHFASIARTLRDRPPTSKALQ